MPASVPTKDRVLRAKIRLLTQTSPFYGMILMGLRFIESARNGTAWVDGVHLGYNPAHIETLTEAELETLLAHEASHVAAGHQFRAANMPDRKRAAIAVDYAVDLNLYAYKNRAGTCPFVHNAQWLTPDPKYKGQSFEEIYSQLPPTPGGNGGKKPQQGQPANGKADPTKPQPDDDPDQGDVYPHPAKTDAEKQEAQAKNIQTVSQAAQGAEKYGTLPADVQLMIDELKKPVVHWREQLRQFLTRSNNETTWKTPRRRALAGGMYLPSKTGSKCPPLVIVRDSSGSTRAMAAQFTAEVAAIHADVQPEQLYIIDVDSRVQHVHEFAPFDQVPADLTMYGGGGTRFNPAFDWVDENMDAPPACLVYLTDLDGPEPVDAPPYPVLWVSTDRRARSFAFGERIDMNP